ncbi:hypothetical protein A8140_22785 [Vibrio campbellii CAIM 519 = NBRC 15631 = ATCC 25920]|nr:hypothetical protein A8140_22785 [Vibrio campbellii CAIM 519 = NBRC 15631 = ATCC 25920]ELU51557.1 hypothetical protein B878_12410 [Vibrio campbellii CAIM 519 = NBRC 15631 = ATCC 25920]
MGLITRERVKLLLRLREPLRLFPQEQGQPSGSGGTIEIALNKDKMEIKKMVLKTSSPSDSSEEG